MIFNCIVTGANLYLMSAIICVVCVFYTIIVSARDVFVSVFVLFIP